MATIFEDQYMSVTLNDETLMLGWKESTAQMTAEQFRLSLAGYAADALANRVTKLLVDARKFGFSDPMAIEDWRQQAVLPLYNSAGVKRMAYLFPDNVPELPPSREAAGNENFATRYFKLPSDAQAWLNGGR